MLPLKVWLFIGFLSTSVPQKAFLPNLPVGEYRIIYDAVHRCKNASSHTIRFNLYFNKKSRNTTEIKGNVTFEVPVDDNLVLEVNLSSWSLMGGWIENAYVQKFDKLCSNIKMIGGKAWSPILESFNITTNCPLPKGTYITSGFDVHVIDDNSLPKVYFYGKYKLTLKQKNKNNTLIGCVAMDFKLVRPWELPQ